MQLRHLECNLSRDIEPPSLQGKIEGWDEDDWISLTMESVAGVFYFRVQRHSQDKTNYHESTIDATCDVSKVLCQAELTILDSKSYSE